MITYNVTTKLEIPSQIQQRIPTYNTAKGVAVWSSLTDISTRKKLMNRGNNITRVVFTFLFSAISLSLLSLSVSAIIVNAQAHYAGSTPSSDSSSRGSDTHVAEMGICVVGAGGPCNGDSNLAK